MNFSNRDKIILILAVAFIGFLVWSSVAFQGLLAKIVPFFEEFAQREKFLSVVVFILLGTASTMFSSFSSMPLVPIAVIIWGNAFTGIFLFVGWLLGDILSYLVGYWAGHPVAKRFLPYEKIKIYLDKIPPKDQFKMILLFILSTPSEVPGYTIGILRYKFVKYLSATSINELFFSFFTAYAARALVEKNFIVFSGAVIFFVGSFSYCFYLFNRYLRAK